jgi:hypothetical protein
VRIATRTSIGPRLNPSALARAIGYALLVLLGFALWIPALLHTRFRDAPTSPVASSTPADSAKRTHAFAEHGASARPGRFEHPTVISFATAHRTEGRRDPGEIILTATILGKTRRGAVLNGRLYREGDRVINRGEPYRLSAVLDDRVELSPIRSSGHRRSLTVVPHPASLRPAAKKPLRESTL